MPVRLWFIEMVFVLTVSASIGQAQPPDPGKATKRQPEQEIPTLEFLEFLGEWETEDGQWIDPEALEQMSLPDPEQEKDEEDE